ncbi:hypothetical protein CU254_03640 [Amycolatopsis sp. AA4]|nr:hypothetical protein CU254_03640 [Amycolatopsis sp. AA4]
MHPTHPTPHWVHPTHPTPHWGAPRPPPHPKQHHLSRATNRHRCTQPSGHPPLPQPRYKAALRFGGACQGIFPALTSTPEPSAQSAFGVPHRNRGLQCRPPGRREVTPKTPSTPQQPPESPPPEHSPAAYAPK